MAKKRIFGRGKKSRGAVTARTGNFITGRKIKKKR